MTVGPGTEVPPFVVESVPAEAMKTVAALLHDPNPIHFDLDAVQALGMGDRQVNQGPTNMAYVVNALTAARSKWMGFGSCSRAATVFIASTGTDSTTKGGTSVPGSTVTRSAAGR